MIATRSIASNPLEMTITARTGQSGMRELGNDAPADNWFGSITHIAPFLTAVSLPYTIYGSTGM
jgi:hypothetical protein